MEHYYISFGAVFMPTSKASLTVHFVKFVLWWSAINGITTKIIQPVPQPLEKICKWQLTDKNSLVTSKNLKTEWLITHPIWRLF